MTFPPERASRSAIFDVNETMLDLRALDPLFMVWFGDTAVRREWFAQTIHYALTFAGTRTFRNFGEIALTALATVAAQHRIELASDATALLRETMLQLPPHPDVESALSLLHGAGYQIAALSNNPLPVVQQQLHHAGLATFFAEIMSVDEARALKPAPKVYRFALARLGLPAPSVWMVAAHGWDIAGATRVGMRGAFVARPGQAPDPFAPPEIVADELESVARAILRADGIA